MADGTRASQQAEEKQRHMEDQINFLVESKKKVDKKFDLIDQRFETVFKELAKLSEQMKELQSISSGVALGSLEGGNGLFTGTPYRAAGLLPTPPRNDQLNQNTLRFDSRSLANAFCEFPKLSQHATLDEVCYVFEKMSKPISLDEFNDPLAGELTNEVDDEALDEHEAAEMVLTMSDKVVQPHTVDELAISVPLTSQVITYSNNNVYGELTEVTKSIDQEAAMLLNGILEKAFNSKLGKLKEITLSTPETDAVITLCLLHQISSYFWMCIDRYSITDADYEVSHFSCDNIALFLFDPGGRLYTLILWREGTHLSPNWGSLLDCNEVLDIDKFAIVFVSIDHWTESVSICSVKSYIMLKPKQLFGSKDQHVQDWLVHVKVHVKVHVSEVLNIENLAESILSRSVHLEAIDIQRVDDWNPNIIDFVRKTHKVSLRGDSENVFVGVQYHSKILLCKVMALLANLESNYYRSLSMAYLVSYLSLSDFVHARFFELHSMKDWNHGTLSTVEI